MDAPEPSASALQLAIESRLKTLDRELDEDDPRTLFRFLLKMARHELERVDEPPIRADLLDRFESLLLERPPVSLDHAQLFIDAPSALRRAEIILRSSRGGKILALGDDDAVSLALLLMGAASIEGAPCIEIADIDEALLAFLEQSARMLGCELKTHRIDLFEESPGPALLDRFEIVFTDPPRSYEDGLAFIAYAARCLVPSQTSRLFYADHEDWNDEHDALREALRGLGLEPIGEMKNAARYPLIERWIPSLDERAAALELAPQDLRALIALIPARSHLYELALRV